MGDAFALTYLTPGTLLVCGSRSGVRWERVWDELDDVLRHYGPFARLIEGCARGVDRDAEAWAGERQLPIDHFPADWRGEGQIAGILRNKRMLDERPDLVVAFYAALRQDEEQLRARGRVLELDPTARAAANDLFIQASGLRRARMALIEQCGLN